MNRLAAILVALVLAAGARGQDFPVGTVLVSRNADESQNQSPGYRNHLAIVVGEGRLVESQDEVGVIATPVADYVARPYSRIVALRPRDAECGAKAAQRAERLVGLPYGRFSSLWPIHGKLRKRLGLNCVSVIEIAYRRGSINRPDRLFAFSRTFQPAETVR